MALEIERKFLVHREAWLNYCREHQDLESHALTQGYFVNTPTQSVRVRIDDGLALLTLKEALASGVRHEFEIEIALEVAQSILSTLTKTLSKTRVLVPYEGYTWEVDLFHGALEGLIVAEVELPSMDVAVTKPPFVGKEVTHDPRYLNAVLLEKGLP